MKTKNKNMSTAPFGKIVLHAIFYMVITAAHGAMSIYNKSDGHILNMHIFFYSDSSVCCVCVFSLWRSLSNCKWMKNGGVHVCEIIVSLSLCVFRFPCALEHLRESIFHFFSLFRGFHHCIDCVGGDVFSTVIRQCEWNRDGWVHCF